MAGLEDAAIHAAAEMLDEGAEQARMGGADREIAMQADLDVTHGKTPVGTSGDRTELFRSCE